MGLALIGCGAFWLLIAAASPYGNSLSVECSIVALLLVILVSVADYHRLWR